MKAPLNEWPGRDVVVVAAGVRYRGVLREVTEDHVCLQARTGWREIPMEQVTDIRLADEVKDKTLGSVFRDWQEF